MALAIRIRADVTETTRISPRTWNENPMGAAFTIDAPLPPIPVSPKPIAKVDALIIPHGPLDFLVVKRDGGSVTHKYNDGSSLGLNL